MQQRASRIVRPGQPQQILLTHRKRNSPQILRHKVTGVIINGNAGRLVPLVDSVGGDDRRGVSVLNDRVQNAFMACPVRAGGRGGVAISFSGNDTTTYIHLFEGAMYELYNQLKAHIERQAKLPTATNVVRLGRR
jgi:hypothetical protein